MSAESQAIDVIDLISQSPWFDALDAAAHEALASEAQIRSYEKNAFLYRNGEQTTNVYCLTSGRVRLGVSTPKGQEFSIAEVQPVFWLGEPVICDDGPRVLDARVVQDATTVEIHKSVMTRVASEFPDMYRLLFAESIRRSRRMYEGLPFLLYPLKARLAQRIMELLADYGKQTEDGVLLDVRLTQNDFARLTLGSRQHINRIIRDWADRQIVVSGPDGYLVPNVDALRNEAEMNGEQ